MVHEDHVKLIASAIPKGNGVWADLGSGEGAFTLALRDLGGVDIEIYSIDENSESLKKQKATFTARFPDSNIQYQTLDFTKLLDLPLLDGILMANSLHYVKDHISFLQSLHSYLKPHGKLVIVEYNVDRGNQWVPYPLSYLTFVKEAEAAGFKNIQLLNTIPSQFLREMYSTVAYR